MGFGNRMCLSRRDGITVNGRGGRLQFDQPVQSTLLNAISRMGQVPSPNVFQFMD